MFQAQNKETINSTWKVAVSFKFIVTTSMTGPCFTAQHQTCKTKTETDFLVSDRSFPKTDGLRSHHRFVHSVYAYVNKLYIFSGMKLLTDFWAHCFQGADSLRPLLEESTQYIPQSKWRETSIALKATAGLRMLSNETAAQILEKVERVFVYWWR